MPFTGGERPVGEHSTAGRALVHHRTTQTCHSEERSDVGISGRQLRFRRWLSHDPAGYCEIATSAYGLLAMTNRGASTVLTAAGTDRQFIAGRGMPLPYNKCMRSAMACATCECLPEIAPQGHFLALRAQGATGAERPRNDRANGLPEAQKIRGCDLQSRRFFGFDQALPAQPRTSLSLCSTRALMLARAGLRYWRGSK